MFSSGGTCSAPLAANCIMFDRSLEARIKSIVRGMSLPPELARKRLARKRFARKRLAGKRIVANGTGKTSRAHRGFQFPHCKFQFSNQPVRLAPKKLLPETPVK